MARPRKRRRPATVKPKAPARLPLPPAPLPDQVPPGVPSSAPKSGDELGALEAQFRADELADVPPVVGVVGELAPGAPAAVAAAAPAARDAIDVAPAEFMRNLAKTAFAIAALRLGPHWELSEQEAKLIGDAAAPIGARMLDQVEGLWVELGVVAVVLFPIVAPRVKKDAELARRRADVQPAGQEATP